MDIYTLSSLVEKYSNKPQPWLNHSINPSYFQISDIDYDQIKTELGPIPGPVHDSDTIELIREKVKKSWENDHDRRDRLIESNKTTHKQKMISKWETPSEAMINRKCHGRPKGAKDIAERKKRPEKKIYIKGKIYYNAYEAAKDIGIHPVNIRRRCRLDQYKEWKYV